MVEEDFKAIIGSYFGGSEPDGPVTKAFEKAGIVGVDDLFLLEPDNLKDLDYVDEDNNTK